MKTKTKLPRRSGSAESVKNDKKILLRAAFMLDQEADSLRESHTVNGRWPASEKQTRGEYGDMIAIAGELRRIVFKLRASAPPR